jgi:hypothetical protein
MQTDGTVQIDVIEELENGVMKCNMYTPVGCYKIAMSKSDYEDMRYNGFFIREGNEKDSAGVINTTHTYHSKKKKPN